MSSVSVLCLTEKAVLPSFKLDDVPKALHLVFPSNIINPASVCTLETEGWISSLKSKYRHVGQKCQAPSECSKSVVNCSMVLYDSQVTLVERSLTAVSAS